MKVQENKIQEEQYSNLVWSIVHKILAKINDKYYYNGLEEDLFQEGYIGLLYASEKYEKILDVQFSTFAYKYIYGYCFNYLKKEFVSLQVEDIDNSPSISETTYEIDDYLKIDLIDEINNRLKMTNRKLQQIEENILRDRLLMEYTLEKCAERNNCSIKKVTNVINKYKSLIKDILIN